MVDLFLRFFNLSVSASWLVLAVLCAQLLLGRLRAPRWVAPLLWGLVGLRLALPFSIPSPLSLIPSAQTLSPHTVHYDPSPTIQSGVRVINNAVNPVLSKTFAAAPTTSVNPLDTAVFLAGVLWAVGMALLALYALVSYLRLRRRVSTAVLLRDNIYQSEAVASPFVLGLFRPKIYLPFDMPQVHMDHVIAHENAHLRRGDHWAKPLGFLLLTLYWFNPLLWVSYALLCRDLELACDERVIRDLDPVGRADYSQALLRCGAPRRSLAVCPLAFGEVGLKARIKNVLHYKKPAFWAVLCALVLCAGLAVGFLTDPAPAEEPKPSAPVQTQTPAPSAPAQTQTPEPTPSIPVQTGASIPTDPEGASLVEAFAVLQYFYVHDVSGDTIPASASVTLGMREDPDTGTGTVYTLCLDRSYAIDLDNGQPRPMSSAYIPMVYTFVRDENRQYVLKEAWQPTGGEGLADEIRSNLPPDLAEKALHPEEYAADLEKQCEKLFWYIYEHDSRTLESRVTALLTAICSSPAASSRPGDYIEAHRAEYDKLLAYGNDALCYLYGQFLNGVPAGLSGQIMCAAMADLLGEEAPEREAGDTPQAYFDALLAQARGLLEEHEVSYIMENYPKSLLLLMLTGDLQASLGLPGATVLSYSLDGTFWDLEKDGKRFVVMEEDGTHIALEEDGTAWAWGSNTYGQLEDVTFRIRAISPGRAIWTWGSSPAPEETAGPE